MRRWLDERFPIIFLCLGYFKQVQVPKNLNIYYCLGGLAVIVFVGQWLSGLWLTMFYTPSVEEAFNSVEFIMRDVSFGWLFRYIHTTGVSAFLLILYLHIFRGLLYGSYQKPRELVWILGVFLLLFTMLEAFFGQILPWSQMSYWGAQVLTSLLSVIPGIGNTLVSWLRGGYAVDDATLHRFFALHVIAIPLILLFLIMLHVIAIHQVGSNNPDGIDIKSVPPDTTSPDLMPFYPDYLRKNFLTTLIFLLVFFSVVFFFPDMDGFFLEKTDFIPADMLHTPETIAPMWYMLPFYSLLRAFPSKTGGVIAMLSAMVILFFLPWLDKSPVRSMRYKGVFSKISLSLFGANFIFLGYLGTIEVTPICQHLSQFSALIYFAYFFLMPCYTRYESSQIPPKRINL